MPDLPHAPDDLDQLLVDLLDGTIDDAGVAALKAQLQADPTARRRIRHAARFEVLLHRAAGQAGAPQRRPNQVVHLFLWPALAAAAALVIAITLAQGGQSDVGDKAISVLAGQPVDRQTSAPALAPGQVLASGQQNFRIALPDGLVLTLEPQSLLRLPAPGQPTCELIRGSLTAHHPDAANYALRTAFGAIEADGGQLSVTFEEDPPCRGLLVGIVDGSASIQTTNASKTIGPGEHCRLYSALPPWTERHLTERLIETWDPALGLLTTCAPDGSDLRSHASEAGLRILRDGERVGADALRPGARVSLSLDGQQLVNHIVIRGHSMRGVIEAIDPESITLRVADTDGPQACNFDLAEGWHVLVGPRPGSRDRLAVGQQATCDLTTDSRAVVRIILPPTGQAEDIQIDFEP